MKKIIALLLCAVMLVAAIGCDNGTSTPEASSTAAPAESAAPATDDTTAEAADDTTAAAADDTTEAVVDTTAEETEAGEPVYGENEFGKLEGEQLLALKDTYPALLPDNTVIEDVVRVFCLDETFDKDGDGNHYALAGNSAAASKYVDTTAGALYGLALNIGACGANNTSRAEVTVTPYDDVSVVGVKGIMFWVDFSHTEIQTDTSKKYQYCASVTINTNDYRSNKDSNGSVGYYYLDGAWYETKNINACRMELPNQFKGWVYVPATSYCKTSDKTAAITDADGKFTDFDIVKNIRLYTDGYVYSDSADQYVIFDEITFIY